MNLTCLDFIPTDEQLAMMKQALKGNKDAGLDLALHHNILYLPELEAWFGTDDSHIEEYRCGYISAVECKRYFPKPKYQSN